MKRGDIVEIHNSTMAGELCVEGRAKLIRKLKNGRRREYWVVRFVGDPCTCPRWVEKASR